MHLVLKKVQFLHFLTWNKSPLSVYNIPYFSMFVYFFFFKRLKNVHFLIKIHIFGRNALNCALYLEFNAFLYIAENYIFYNIHSWKTKYQIDEHWQKEYRYCNNTSCRKSFYSFLHCFLVA